MEAECKVSIVDNSGTNQEIDLNLEMYAEAADRGMSFAQLVNSRHPTNIQLHGSAFHQAMANSGLLLSEDRHYGLRPSTLYQIMYGNATLSASAITAPDGSSRNTPAGRLLFPAVLLDLLEDQLRDNRESYNSRFLQMVAFTRSITSPRYDQVIINQSAPRAARGMPISQLAEPQRMLSITTSSVQRSLPTYSLGMEFSMEALKAATLDLIGLAVSAHSIEERSSQLENDLVNVVQGDTDSGEAGIIGSAFTATSLDATIAGVDGLMTQRAWVKYLRNLWRKRQITDVIGDVDSYLSVEARTGRITASNRNDTDERLNPTPTIVLPGVQGVNFFVTEGSPFGANTLVGLDRTKALRRIVYTGADYNAIQEFVMRKSMSMRLDWAERIESAGYSEAFSVMTMT